MSYSDMTWYELEIQALQDRNNKQYERLEEKDQEIQKLKDALIEAREWIKPYDKDKAFKAIDAIINTSHSEKGGGK